MYIDTTTSRRGNKIYVRHLLRTSYRENGKVKHKTIANLSNCPEEEIAALKLALKHKGKLHMLASLDDLDATLGKRIGAVWTLNVMAERLGITKALGTDEEAQLALLQIITRTIDQGSRLSAVRFAMRHAICEILGIKKLDENDLYANLAWLAEHQEEIEKRLFEIRFPDTHPSLFLYDVTSSYLEGECNELANWGYNRDKKKGKKQIVAGLLAASDGLPVAIRVFEGNTTDTKTVADQVRILAKSFGVKNVTLVGDRGMLKGPQIESLPDDFRYITAITKPQIQKMLSEGKLQYELFNEKICEIKDDGIRYVLRRNPIRAEQMAESRESKLSSIMKVAEKQTLYLTEHPGADAAKALGKVIAKIEKLKAAKWLTAEEQERVISVNKDDEALSKVALLDGCYVIKSDVTEDEADAQTLHDRYCDLEMIERTFRTMKTTHLEMRPVFVKKKTSTQGHAFVVMLALLLQRELERCWKHIDVSVEEGINELASIHFQDLTLGNKTVQNIPSPTKLGRQLLEGVAVVLPSVFPKVKANVHTTKKLPPERKLQ